jgi:hypothetical protein
MTETGEADASPCSENPGQLLFSLPPERSCPPWLSGCIDPGWVEETADVTAVTALLIIPGFRAALLRFAVFLPALALAGLRAGVRLLEAFLADFLVDPVLDLVAVLRAFLAGFFADFLLAFLAITFLLGFLNRAGERVFDRNHSHRTFARDSLSRFACAAKSKAAIKRIFPFLIAAIAVRVQGRGEGNARTDLIQERCRMMLDLASGESITTAIPLVETVPCATMRSAFADIGSSRSHLLDCGAARSIPSGGNEPFSSDVTDLAMPAPVAAKTSETVKVLMISNMMSSRSF